MKFFYIYKTINLINNKYYIGKASSVNPFKHKYLGSGCLLKKAIEKYGKHNFQKVILYITTSEKEAYLLERQAVNVNLINDSKCYNLKEGGTGSVEYSDEARRNMSRNRKGVKMSPEARKRMNQARKGVPRSKETKRKISEAQIGKVIPESVIYNIRISKNNGIWHTPLGDFASMSDIESVYQGILTTNGVRKKCKNPNKVIRSRKPKCKNYYNKTNKECGFWYEETSEVEPFLYPV